MLLSKYWDTRNFMEILKQNLKVAEAEFEN